MTERGLKNINVFYSTFTNGFFVTFFIFFLERFFYIYIYIWFHVMLPNTILAVSDFPSKLIVND